MRYLLIVCAAVLVCEVIAFGNIRNKVKVAVYYDSMDPESKRFFKSQLVPVMHSLSSNVLLVLIPYGRTTREKIGDKWSFTCPYGEEGCYSNKVHLCILADHSLWDLEKMNIISCLMRQNNPANGLATCLAVHKKTSELTKLTYCTNNTRGDNLLAYCGELTDLVMKPFNLPTVFINPNKMRYLLVIACAAVLVCGVIAYIIAKSKKVNLQNPKKKPTALNIFKQVA